MTYEVATTSAAATTRRPVFGDSLDFGLIELPKE